MIAVRPANVAGSSMTGIDYYGCCGHCLLTPLNHIPRCPSDETLSRFVTGIQIIAAVPSAPRHRPADPNALRHRPADLNALLHRPADLNALRHHPADPNALRHRPADPNALRHHPADPNALHHEP